MKNEYLFETPLRSRKDAKRKKSDQVNKERLKKRE